jgi:hypothetical protein
MTTVITYKSGNFVRRCDAHCHMAKGDSCECICNGRNHGVGFKQAIANVREDMEELFQEENIEYTFDIGEVDTVVDLQQDIESRALSFGGIA